MLHVTAPQNENDAFGIKKKPIKFLSNLFKRKKSTERKGCVKIDTSEFAGQMERDSVPGGLGVTRIPSTLSVQDIMVAPYPPSPALSTPARNRDIDNDMEALRISRQDNPFLKQVLASRESLADSLEESESDDINLMSQEFSGDLGTDPFSLPEVHQHMIRSPPPTSWPRSPNFKMFRFPVDSDQDSSQESLKRKSPSRVAVSPRSDQPLDSAQEDVVPRPVSCALSPRLNLPLRPHQRSNSDAKDRSFSLLTPAPLRSLSDVRRLHSSRDEDSQQLVATDSSTKSFT